MSPGNLKFSCINACRAAEGLFCHTMPPRCKIAINARAQGPGLYEYFASTRTHNLFWCILQGTRTTYIEMFLETSIIE